MRKYSQKVNFIGRVAKNMSLHTKMLLYKSVAAPHFQFSPTLLYVLPKLKIGQVQVIQNRAMRLLNCTRYTSVRELLTVFDMLSVNQKIMFDVAVFSF